MAAATTAAVLRERILAEALRAIEDQAKEDPLDGRALLEAIEILKACGPDPAPVPSDRRDRPAALQAVQQWVDGRREVLLRQQGDQHPALPLLQELRAFLAEEMKT